jgi:hypothetical protein
MSNIAIDCETADRITVLTLQNHKDYILAELEDIDEKNLIHPEDVIKNQQLVKAIDFLIDEYFGSIYVP